MSAEESEVRAREMGWLPQEEFKGDPDRWVDAETFVKRGEEMLPLIKANARRLETELEKTRGELKKVTTLLQASAESIEELKNFNSKIARERAEINRRELVSAIALARKDNDIEKEAELQEQLTEQTKALREAEKTSDTEGKPAAKPAAAAPQPELTPVFKEWMGENTWFGTDKRKTSLAMGIAEEIRSTPDGAKLPEAEFLKKVTEEVEATLGGNAVRRAAPAKVEGDVGGTRPAGGAKGKSYADLPAEARAACDRQGNRLVGEGRAFKDVNAWRKHYAEKYFSE